MDFSWDNMLAFIEEQWWMILIAAIALLVVIRIVKAVIKWVIVIAVIVGLFLYGMNYESFRDAVDSVTEYSMDAAFEAMTGEAENAEYTLHDDGTYTVESQSIRLEGSLDSEQVSVYFHGIKISDIKVTEAIKTYIDTARNNG